MTRYVTLGALTVASAATLFLGGTAFASSAQASPVGTAFHTEHGIVCPRGQHAYHAPGGAVSCIPNGVTVPTHAPPAPPN
ncbi:MAG TPA: hypothetical protein VGH89_20885 [Pseudonocardia sp.]|jgi:hypothetical protein